MTLAVQGEQMISVKCNGSSQCCTVLLGVAMDGTKLPPYIIFKGKESGHVIHKFTLERMGYLQD